MLLNLIGSQSLFNPSPVLERVMRLPEFSLQLNLLVIIEKIAQQSFFVVTKVSSHQT